MAHKVILWRIARHEFNRALRAWSSYLSPKEVFVYLLQQRSKALATAIKSLAVATIGTMWLLENKSVLSFKAILIEISIPAAYVTIVVVLALAGTIIQVLNYFVLNEFVRIASNRLFKFDSPWALTSILDGDNAWNIANIPQFRFFNSSSTHKQSGLLIGLLINIPILTLVLFCFINVLSASWRVVVEYGWFSSTTGLTIIAWLTLAVSIVQVCMMFVRFAFKKNTGYIRWHFLYRLHARSGASPPNVSAWLAGPP